MAEIDLTKDPYALNKIMEFDHVVRVHSDGTVTSEDGVYAPEVYVSLDHDGQLTDDAEPIMISDLETHDWEALTGHTGQYGYNGALMHPSEFIGGSLAREILETPGLYVALIPSSLDSDDDIDAWIIAYREIETITWQEVQERYEDFLDETNGEIRIGDLTYQASRVLREVDPTAYRVGFHDWADSEGIDTDHLEGEDTLP